MEGLHNKFIKLGRTFKEGFSNFWRNGWLSFATVSVLAISLYIISITIILGITASLILKNIEDKVNVSVYFNPDVEENVILQIKDKLSTSGFQEVKSVDYISKGQAYEQFKKDSMNDPVITDALNAVGENPLLSALVIKANRPDQYDTIVSNIQQSYFKDNINRINYDQNKDKITRLNTINKLVRQVGLTLGIIFVFIGVLITFNAIRLTMYAHKQEFEIMRLVGASNMYIRVPFVFEGVFYGIFSSILVMLMLFATSKFVAPLTRGSIPQGDLVGFYFSHFWLILGGLVVSGVFLGVISGIIAIRRYLKV